MKLLLPVSIVSVAVAAALAGTLSQPEPTAVCEAPDGSKLPILQSSSHTLVIEDARIGEGDACDRRSVITVHYHGTLADGTVFDSTRGKEPAKFPLDRLIPGWQAGVPGMKVGGIRRLVIPSVMAYGAQERRDDEGRIKLPANSDLTFSIELVGFESPQAAQPAAAKGEPVTLPSGLVIEDMVVGTGAECPRGATVKVHYKGTLTNGKEFDSSYGRGQPIEFPLANLIQGWQEGIPGMKVGGKRRLTVPYQMGYGERGFPPDIPPRATLIFEIELLGFR